MDDLIAEATDQLEGWYRGGPLPDGSLVFLLINALKAAHKEIDWLHGEIDRLRVRGDY